MSITKKSLAIKERVRNIKELARLAGFSVSTVSRVLNGKGDLYRISPRTSELILKAAAEYDYFPNRIARGLRLERTETLGLIIPDIANPFFASIAKIVEFEARKQGYSLILCDSLDDIQTEKELLSLLAGRKVEGIILAPVGQTGKHIQDFYKSGIPVVVIDRYLPGTSIPYITTDNCAGAYEATEYLISRGHRKIACIQGLIGISVNNDRVSGYRQALIDNGIDPDDNLILGDNFGEENGYIQTRLLISRKNPPTAIFALSNLISLGVMKALCETGHRIPEDMSLVSFDDQPYSSFLASPMTTVDQKKEEIAKIAVNVLLEIIRTGEGSDNVCIMLKPRLIIRESVLNLKAPETKRP